MLYTLIAYKSNSSDYCRGCLMASYKSDFEIWTGTELDALAVRWAALQDRNRKLGHGEDGYDFTLLIDGVPAPYSDVREFDQSDGRDALWRRQEELSDTFDQVNAAVAAKLTDLDQRRVVEAEEAARKAALAAEKAANAAAAAKEAKERAEYARLAAKFGGAA